MRRAWAKPAAISGLWLPLLLSGCGHHAKATPSPAELQAREQAAAQAAAQRLQAQRQQEAQERLRQRRQRLAQEFTELEQQHAAVLAVLLKWQSAGDGRAELLSQTLAGLALLPGLQPLVEACGARLHELADHPQGPGTPPELAGRVRNHCDLAMRAQAIGQRQVLAQLRVLLAPPSWIGDVATRYAQQGKVSWHQWLELLTMEEDYAARAAPLRQAAAAAELALPTAEHLAPAQQARAALLRQMQALQGKLALPAGLDDARFAAQVKAAWEAAAPLGPLAGWRQAPLQVRALDAVWQVLIDPAGKPTRRLREFAALVPVQQGPSWAQGCWVLWGVLEQQRGRTQLRWGDDLRRTRCPGAAKGGAVVASAERGRD